MTVRTVPASVGQRLLWLLDRRRGEGGALDERLAWRIVGPLDVDALQQALDALAARHEALRTTFTGSASRLVQVVHSPGHVQFARRDCVTSYRDDHLENLVNTEFEARTNPADMPLRVGLWRLDDHDYLLHFSINPLVTDHQSNLKIATDLGVFYDAFAEGIEPDLPMIEWQYADWAEWQRTSFADGRLTKLQDHWRDVLTNARPFELPRLTTGAARGEKAYEWRRLGAEVARSLACVARDYDSSPFAVALAAFYVHLYGLTGQDDMVVASLFANRTRREIRHTVGFFVNLIPLRGTVGPSHCFAEVLLDTTAMIERATIHQELPYHMLPAKVAAAREVVFQFIDGEPRPTALTRLRGLELTPIERQSNRARFTLELFVAYARDHVSPVLLYDRARIDDAWAESFADGYVRLLRAVAVAPAATVGALLSSSAR